MAGWARPQGPVHPARTTSIAAARNSPLAGRSSQSAVRELVPRAPQGISLPRSAPVATCPVGCGPRPPVARSVSRAMARVPRLMRTPAAADPGRCSGRVRSGPGRADRCDSRRPVDRPSAWARSAAAGPSSRSRRWCTCWGWIPAGHHRVADHCRGDRGFGMLAHRRGGHVRRCRALLRGAGSRGGRCGHGCRSPSPDVLLAGFAVLMLAVAALMLTRRRVRAGGVVGQSSTGCRWTCRSSPSAPGSSAPAPAPRRCSSPRSRSG